MLENVKRMNKEKYKESLVGVKSVLQGWLERREMDSSGSRYGQVAGSWKRDN